MKAMDLWKTAKTSTHKITMIWTYRPFVFKSRSLFYSIGHYDRVCFLHPNWGVARLTFKRHLAGLGRQINIPDSPFHRPKHNKYGCNIHSGFHFYFKDPGSFMKWTGRDLKQDLSKRKGEKNKNPKRRLVWFQRTVPTLLFAHSTSGQQTLFQKVWLWLPFLGLAHPVPDCQNAAVCEIEPVLIDLLTLGNVW